MRRHLRLILLISFAVAVVTGCSRDDDIRRYSVPKPKTVAVGTDRLLGAISLRGEQGWFFKMTGTEAQVGPQAEAFRSLVKSVRFGADGTPTWTLPEKWEKKPGNEQRFATLGPAGQSLEASVTVLPRSDIGENVNRWRRQMSLRPADPAEIAALPTLELAEGQKATFVDLTGALDASAMPPFAGGRAGAPQASASGTSTTSAVKFETPTGWSPGKPSTLRKASLMVRDGAREADISVTSFPASAAQIADPLANVNRWRDEIGLPVTTSKDLTGSLKEIKVAGRSASYVELMGPADAVKREATLAAWFTAGDQVWFAKMRGDAALVEAQRANFTTFLGSLRID